MKRVLSIAALLLLSYAAPSSAALIVDPVSTGDLLTIRSTDGNIGGGPFHVDVQPYASGSGYDFLSFCMERTEYFSYGATYQATLATVTTTNDPLDSRTAYLYSRFRKGFIQTDTFDKANALQLAIWRLEGEVTNDGLYSNLGSTAARALADSYIATATANADGSLYGVGILQLRGLVNGAYTGAAQDQLYMHEVPEPASLMLLGLGLVGAAGVIRRRR